VKRNYHTIDKQGKVNARQLGDFLSKSGQQLLPTVDLIEQCQMACDELIDVAGRATIPRVRAGGRPSPRVATALSCSS
jgi:hypothetical protein